jgi:hypothetical protein
VTMNRAAIGNQPPVVNAGSNQSITLPASASLSGTVSDDGLPGPPAALTTTWAVFSGPGTVTFGDPSALSTTANFSVSGTYVLRLTANDGDLTASADVTVNVNPAGAPGFALELQSTTPSAFANGTSFVVFSVVREGGFSEPIGVTVAAPPPGIASDTAQLQGRVTDSALLLTIDPSVAPGDVSIEVVASGGGITRTAAFMLTIRAAEPRAQEKIQAALDAGTIDRPTSLLYRAFALFKDPRLPEAYRGSGSVEEDRSLLAEIAAILPTASPQLRAQLEPFTLRPAHDNSWYNQLVASLSGATTATVAAAVPLISAYGASGAAGASAIGYACGALVAWVQFRRLAGVDPR